MAAQEIAALAARGIAALAVAALMVAAACRKGIRMPGQCPGCTSGTRMALR
ncbi:hypothetical protein GCM10027414_09910 [Humibacter ginsengiterrae]